MSATSEKGGFTLVELLVVIAVIGVLIALLLPAVQAAREAGRRMSCQNNLKQIGLAAQNFHDVKGHLPPAFYLEEGEGMLAASQQQAGPMLYLLPYLEAANSFVQFDPDLSIEHPDNAGVAETIIPVFLCPSMQYDLGDSPLAPTSYKASTSTLNPWAALSKFFAHNGAIIVPLRNVDFFNVQTGQMEQFSNPIVRLRDVTDGLTTTFAFGETDYFGGRATGGPRWAGGYIADSLGCTLNLFNPSDPFDPLNPPPFDPQNPSDSITARDFETAFRSDHPGGVYFVMLDGSVQFLRDETDPDTLDALVTRAQGEIVSDFK